MDDLHRVALQLHQAGRFAEAEEGYRKILAANPQHAGVLHGLGMLALAAEEPAMAEQLIRRAIAVRGEWAEGCYHLGVALQARERFDEAILAHRRAAALKSDLFDAHYNLAVCLQLSGQRDRAIASYRQAIALRGNDAVALTNFAIALRGAGHVEEAIAACRQAVAHRPDFAEGHLQLGIALRDAGRLEEAIAAFGRSGELKPAAFAAWTHLASAYRETGQIDQAIGAQRHAVALRPDDADANTALAELLLLHGDLVEGFEKLEWRWKRKTLPWPRRKFAQPMWDGSDLAGRAIYLHAEQSLSDAIHFSRYIPLVAARGGKIVVEVQPTLRRLFTESFGSAVQQWFSPGEPAPAFDVYCPLMSLTGILGIPPKQAPYLRPASPMPIESPRRIGLVWAGSPAEVGDRSRSMSLADFAPLVGMRGVEFFRLQHGRAAAESQAPLRLVEPATPWSDFADTAAILNQLDLIITIDTAIAHLAGAMGKPVWTLLPSVPHWRWRMFGESTPWYPTMRLFRQSRRGDWGDVMRRVAAALSEAAAPRFPSDLG